MWSLHCTFCSAAVPRLAPLQPGVPGADQGVAPERPGVSAIASFSPFSGRSSPASYAQPACMRSLAPLLACIHHSVPSLPPPRPLFNAPQAFVSILNAVRFGDNAAAQRLYQQCRRPLAERDGIKPTQVGLVAVGL